jgi:hypothetical protein
MIKHFQNQFLFYIVVILFLFLFGKPKHQNNFLYNKVNKII